MAAAHLLPARAALAPGTEIDAAAAAFMETEDRLQSSALASSPLAALLENWEPPPDPAPAAAVTLLELIADEAESSPFEGVILGLAARRLAELGAGEEAFELLAGRLGPSEEAAVSATIDAVTR